MSNTPLTPTSIVNVIDDIISRAQLLNDKYIKLWEDIDNVKQWNRMNLANIIEVISNVISEQSMDELVEKMEMIVDGDDIFDKYELKDTIRSINKSDIYISDDIDLLYQLLDQELKDYSHIKSKLKKIYGKIESEWRYNNDDIIGVLTRLRNRASKVRLIDNDCQIEKSIQDLTKLVESLRDEIRDMKR